MPQPVNPPEFFFDVTAPETYLAAERVERWFAGARWIPCAPLGPVAPPRVAAIGARAAALRLPLVWPDARPDSGTAARRVAAFAAERGAGATFALAAGRLAYCGGFDVDDPEILVEAAAVAGLEMADALRAARTRSHDLVLAAAAHRARRAGIDTFPGLVVGPRAYAGEERLGEALVAHRAAALAPR